MEQPKNQAPFDQIELHAIIHGKVQGVCFRATARAIARKLAIRGTVRNLPDGTVELYAQGSRPQLEQLLAALEAAPPPIRVERLQLSWSSPTSSYPPFSIL